MLDGKIGQIRKHGKSAQGKRELLKHLKGGRLTPGQILLAVCYDCTGYFKDGKNDCLMPECPVYPKMPYREA